jgi:hypothetical protein
MIKQSYFLDNTKEISVDISGQNSKYYISIYNDQTNKSVALNVSASKLLGLADFINKFVETHQ